MDFNCTHCCHLKSIFTLRNCQLLWDEESQLLWVVSLLYKMKEILHAAFSIFQITEKSKIFKFEEFRLTSNSLVCCVVYSKVYRRPWRYMFSCTLQCFSKQIRKAVLYIEENILCFSLSDIAEIYDFNSYN